MNKIEITYYIEKKGEEFYHATSNLTRASIYSNILGSGKTEQEAINDLDSKWNKLVKQSEKALKPNYSKKSKVIIKTLTLRRVEDSIAIPKISLP